MAALLGDGSNISNVFDAFANDLLLLYYTSGPKVYSRHSDEKFMVTRWSSHGSATPNIRTITLFNFIPRPYLMMCHSAIGFHARKVGELEGQKL